MLRLYAQSYENSSVEGNVLKVVHTMNSYPLNILQMVLDLLVEILEHHLQV